VLQENDFSAEQTASRKRTRYAVRSNFEDGAPLSNGHVENLPDFRTSGTDVDPTQGDVILRSIVR